MVACPFQIPAYSYHDVLTPQVRKCQFCYHRTTKGQLPACVEACPRQVMTFGKRKELIELAHERISKNPGKYLDHVYGEHEVGGTSWMYLSPVPFEQAGFLTVGTDAPPALTEAIQHGVFKHWIAPIGWYSFLSAMMWFTGRRGKTHKEGHHDRPPSSPEQGDDPNNAAQDLIDSLDRDPSPDDPRSPLLEQGPGLSQRPVQADETGDTEPETREPAIAIADAPDQIDERELSHRQPAHPAPSPHPHADAHHHDLAAPVNHPLNTPGVWVLLTIVLTGIAFWLYRFVMGLAATTNLDQQHPWGLWIAMDVGSGIALAGGGFVTAAVSHIFHRHRYHAIARSALLTALLGYTFYVPGLLADIGRWYNIWHPTIPTMWQGNSVLFEVGICVMIYLNVQYAELTPFICQRLLGEQWMQHWPRLSWIVGLTQKVLNKMMPALIVLGVALSTFHQSSLGNLMVIAPYKLHHLWWTPVSPLLFLLSAMMVGFPMVLFTILFASKCVKREPEMHALEGLAAHYVPVFLSIYLIVKIGDVIYRKMYPYLIDGSYEGILWNIEVLLGVVVPLVLCLIPAVRKSKRGLTVMALMVIFGVILNRLNCFVLAYHPPYATKTYFPSITEFAVSAGLVAALMLVYRVAVTYLPILEPSPLRTESQVAA
jgi:Ni/Fe-hydrogenase subunit HybB-like protein